MYEPLMVGSIGLLEQLEFRRRAVYVKRWGRHMPAAFLMSMQARTLAGLIRSGVYVYESLEGKA